MDIDWTNPECQVTPHFTVNDCLMLHAFNRLATEDDGADFGLLTTLCQTLEQIRAILNAPMNVHCIYRSQAYNQAQNIIPAEDVHSMSLACDFDANEAMTTDAVKALLMPQLESLGIRMENNGAGASWIHVDLHPIISERFFNV
jgi:hypothetical protein